MWCSALGVVAEVLRSRCVVLCTVCKFVSDIIFLATVHHFAMPFTCSATSFTVGFFILSEKSSFECICCSAAIWLCYVLLPARKSNVSSASNRTSEGKIRCLCMIDIELFLRPQLVAHREEKFRNNGKNVLTSLVAIETGVKTTQSHNGDIYGICSW